MNKNLVRSARAIFAVALVLVFVSSPLYAIDSNSGYFAYGVGQRSCEDYIRFREKRIETLERHQERAVQQQLSAQQGQIEQQQRELDQLRRQQAR